MKANEIYEMIEKKVIEQLENGIIPWRRCYHVSSGDLCISHQSGEPYSLLNQFLLELPGEYWTFEQAKKEGYSVRKGAKSSKIVFWKILKTDGIKDNGDGTFSECEIKQIPYLKYYSVFHESDIDGLPPKPANEFDRNRNKESVDEAEKIISKYLENNPDISISDRIIPCFVPSIKTIYVPEKCQFDLLGDYYHTCFHEMTHSTKFALDRTISMSDEDRAKEELVAEIGAAYLCGEAGIDESEVIKNTESYCAGWLKALRNNIKWLIWASSRAEKAAKYILTNEK